MYFYTDMRIYYNYFQLQSSVCYDKKDPTSSTGIYKERKQIWFYALLSG